MPETMQCNFFDIFGFTSNDNHYKSLINLLDKDKFYPRGTIFNYDSILFNEILCFYERTLLIIEIVEEKGLDTIFKFKRNDNPSKSHPLFVFYRKEEKLFRFAEKKWIKKAYLEGNFRIKPALDYLKNEYNEARQDNEQLLEQKILVNGKIDGSKYIIDCNINQYILCMSYEYDARLFEEFKPKGRDKSEAIMACLVIEDTKEFEKRLFNEYKLKEYNLQSSRIFYNNFPHSLNILFNKERKFKMQKEYRFLLTTYNKQINCGLNKIMGEKKELLDKLEDKYFDIYIGSLKDIAYVEDIEGNRINFDV